MLSDVAVVVPCRDGAAYLAAALRSVANQTQRPVEVVVADDGSSDGSAAVARVNGARVIEGPFGGAAPARAAGLAATDAPFVLFLDADDLLGPDALRWLRDAVRSGSAAICAWQDLSLENEAWVTGPPRRDPRGWGQDDLSAWLTGWYCPPCAVLWSREAVAAAGGWADRQLVNDDGDLMMRALADGMTLHRAQGGVAYYREGTMPGATLSGQRLTAKGVADRLQILDGIEGRLRANGQLARYRTPLAHALKVVEADAKAAPDLVEEARQRRRVLGVKPFRLQAGQIARRGSARIQETLRPAPSRREVPLPAGATRALAVPSISVIIPTYNRPDATVRAIESALAQDPPPHEVLVVDDASTDRTAEAVSSLGHGRLQLLRQDRNQGVAAARNRGLREATGHAIGLLDSDDVWLPGKLAAQGSALATGPRDALTYTGAETIGADGGVQRFEPTTEGDLFQRLLHRNVMHGSGSSCVFTRNVTDTIGGFDTGLPANEDWDFLLRAARFFPVLAVPGAFVRYMDDAVAERRSRNVENDLAARAIMRRRYALDVAALGLRQLVTMEAARTRLGAEGRHAWLGRADVLTALALQPRNLRLYPWLGYMMLPSGLRARARRLDGKTEPRTV
ncbi:glycosyltransferase family 2 protein [Parvularcula dongshanensis]|uniref:glycosyltransferase family 2 protein n=1 Tax=Parvularcula dongshanensis TaxID=1173995 RepID=UPI0031B5C26F